MDHSSKTINSRAKLLSIRSKWIVKRIKMRYLAQKLPELWPETWMYQFCDFCIFWVLVKKIRQFLQNPVFAKKYFLTFLAISPGIFKLQRCTIPHFNPLNNSFWPYEEPFCCAVNRFWVMRPNVSPIFFEPYFSQITPSLW